MIRDSRWKVESFSLVRRENGKRHLKDPNVLGLDSVGERRTIPFA